MTITLKGGTIFATREITVVSKNAGEHDWRRRNWRPSKTKISLKPDVADSLNDAVIIKSEGVHSHTLKGEEIKTDPQCKKFGIGWYK